MFGAFDPNEDPDGNPWGGYDNPYDIPNLAVGWNEIESPIHTGAWRAVYYPANVFARECFLDEVAAKAGKDPLALRLALLGGPSPFAYGKRKVDRAGLRARAEGRGGEVGMGRARPPQARGPAVRPRPRLQHLPRQHADRPGRRRLGRRRRATCGCTAS